MRVDLLDCVSFRGGWFVVSLEIDVPETHGELSGGESARVSENRPFYPKNLGTFEPTNEQLTAVGDDRACNAPQ